MMEIDNPIIFPLWALRCLSEAALLRDGPLFARVS